MRKKMFAVLIAMNMILGTNAMAYGTDLEITEVLTIAQTDSLEVITPIVLEDIDELSEEEIYIEEVYGGDTEAETEIIYEDMYGNEIDEFGNIIKPFIPETTEASVEETMASSENEELEEVEYDEALTEEEIYTEEVYGGDTEAETEIIYEDMYGNEIDEAGNMIKPLESKPIEETETEAEVKTQAAAVIPETLDWVTLETEDTNKTFTYFGWGLALNTVACMLNTIPGSADDPLKVLYLNNRPLCFQCRGQYTECMVKISDENNGILTAFYVVASR